MAVRRGLACHESFLVLSAWLEDAAGSCAKRSEEQEGGACFGRWATRLSQLLKVEVHAEQLDAIAKDW